MAPTVFMDKDHQPTDEEILGELGSFAPLWEALTAYLDHAYAIAPTFAPPSRNYGWEVKYRRGGKTLVSLSPDRGGFTALVVLGKKEARAVDRFELGRHVRDVFDGATQLHDGRWLFVPVRSRRDVEDVQRLLAAKRRPRALSPSAA
jgi:hypothetical protein